MKSYVAQYGPDMIAIGAVAAGACGDRRLAFRYKRPATTIADSAAAISGNARRARLLSRGSSSIGGSR